MSRSNSGTAPGPAPLANDARPPAAPAPWRPLLPWLAGAAALIVAVAASAIWLAYQRQIELETVRLESVSALRTQQVSTWIEDRQAQFRFLRRILVWPELLTRWQDQGDDAARALLAERASEYASGHGFTAVLFLDAGGSPLRLNERETPSVPAALREAARRALASDAPSFTDLYLEPGAEPEVRLDFVVPLSNGRAATPPQARWLVAVRLDPQERLLPILQDWPDSRSPVQTLLVRRTGDTLVGPNGRNPVPLARPGLLVGQVVRGAAPAGKALFADDFRGRPVFGVVRPVAGTPWWLVSRVSRDEVMRPVWETAGWISLAAGLCLLLSVGVANLARQRRVIVQTTADRERQARRLRALSLVEALAQSSPDAIFAKDRDGRYLVFNPAASRLSGHSARTAIGRHDRDLFDPGHAALFEAHDRQVIATGQPQHFEERMSGVAGERVLQVVRGPLRDGAGHTVGSFGIARDVTEARRIEAELEHHRRHIDDQVQSRSVAGVPEAIASLFTQRVPGRVAYWDRERRCRYVNDTYCEWFGIRREDLIGRSVDEIFGAGFVAEREERMQRALAGEAQQFERAEVSADGRAATTWVHYIPDGPPGQVRGMFVLATDVSLMKQAEQRQRQVIDELAAARQAAESANIAKSVFLANMSHEIRTPLSAILGLTHLLQDEQPSPAQARRLREIDEAAAHLLQVVDDILDLSKIEAGRLVLEDLPFSLDALLQRSFSMVAPRARARGLEMVIARAPAPDAVRGDPTRLSQAIVNLLSNAVKFTHHGHVVLRCSQISSTAGRVRLRFEVEDSGIGIEGDKQAQLFEAFSQADSSTTRRFGGTGLGLAITRRLASLMGGDVGLSSEFGQGSRFWFSAELAVAGETRAPLLQPALAGRTALLVQAQPATAKAIEQALRDLGMECAVAESLDVAATLAALKRPAVIVADSGLRGLDGVRGLRERWPGVPALLLVDDLAPWQDAATESADLRVLAKPVTPTDLSAALGALLGAAPPQPAPPAAAPAAPPRVTADTLRACHAGARILVAEDNPVNREISVALLAAAGLEADTANDGAEALARVRSARYDLVLMDMQMPVMDGLEATRAIRELAPGRELPIVAMTANAFGEDRAACLAAGMNDYLAKPVEPTVMYATLLRWLSARGAGDPADM
jgi:two-component system, sensor histidine kinase and response regulator